MVPQSKELEGEVDFLIKKDGEVIAIIESKAYKGNYSFTHLYAQAIQYADTNHHNEDVFVIINKGRYISFGQYVRDFHTVNDFYKKGTFFDGYIGYEMDKNLKVYPIPQKNTFNPQHKLYEIGMSSEQNLGIYRCLQFIRSFNGRPSPSDLDFGSKYEVDGDGLINTKDKNIKLPSANTALQRRFIVDRSGHTTIETPKTI